MGDATVSAAVPANRAAPADGELALSAGAARASARYSLFRYSPLLFFLIIIVADASQWADPDLWIHLRAGQSIIANWRVPAIDAYSYSVPGAIWTDHEWLCQALMALAYDRLGVFGLQLWKLLLVAATLSFTSMSIAETGAAPALQFKIMTVVAIALMEQLQYRPQLFSYAIFAGLLVLLARDWHGRRAPLLLVIPLMAIWANLHGGFVMGIAALGIYAGCVMICALFGYMANMRRAVGLGALTLAAAAAALLNPYGIGLWRLIWRAATDPVSRLANDDWLPLSRAVEAQWINSHSGAIFVLCGVGLMAATALAVVLAPRAGDFPFVAIAAIMCAAAISSSRNLPFAIIACVSPLTLRLAKKSRQRESDVRTRSAVNPWIAGLIAIVAVWRLGLVSGRLKAAITNPAGAVRFMRQNSLRGNILNDFNWGDYLIWRLEPQSKVFIDGRYDTLYPYSLIRQYIDFRFDLPGAQKTLDGWPHDFVLVAPGTPAYKMMVKQSVWKLVYLDSVSALFARDGTAGALVTPHLRPAEKPADEYFP